MAAAADDLVVPRKYRKIQYAVNLAQPGDRIVVTGVHHEDVVTVGKSDLTIVGRGATLVGMLSVSGDRVTVSGFRFIGKDDETGGGVAVTGDDVTVTGDTFRNAGVSAGRCARTTIEGCRFGRGASGIDVDEATGAVVRANRFLRGFINVGAGNTLIGNVLGRTRACGILIEENASGTVVGDCTVTGCDLGIVNDANDTSIGGSTMTRNRWADVLDLAGFQVFDGNKFGTLSHDAWLAPTR